MVVERGELGELAVGMSYAPLLPVLLKPESGPDWLGPVSVIVWLCIILTSYALFAREDKKRFAKGDKLFEAVGAFIERTLAGAPIAEAEAAEEEELEVEQTSAPKTMEA